MVRDGWVEVEGVLECRGCEEGRVRRLYVKCNGGRGGGFGGGVG